MIWDIVFVYVVSVFFLYEQVARTKEATRHPLASVVLALFWPVSLVIAAVLKILGRLDR